MHVLVIIRMFSVLLCFEKEIKYTSIDELIMDEK